MYEGRSYVHVIYLNYTYLAQTSAIDAFSLRVATVLGADETSGVQIVSEKHTPDKVKH